MVLDKEAQHIRHKCSIPLCACSGCEWVPLCILEIGNIRTEVTNGRIKSLDIMPTDPVNKVDPWPGDQSPICGNQ